MSKLLKALAALVFILLIAVAVLVVLIDPNDYKAELQDVARKQNIDLKLQGDLSWQLWPSLGIEVGKISATPLTPYNMPQNKMARRPLAEIEHLSASVQVMPLFKGRIAIDGIVVDQAHFSLRVDHQGRGNWQLAQQTPQKVLQTQQTASKAAQSLADQQPASASAATPAESASAKPLELAIDSIELRQISADYTDLQKDQKLSLQQLNIIIKQFNNSDQPFSLQLDWQTAINDKANQAVIDNRGELSTTMTLSQDFSRYSFASTALNTELSGKAAGHNIQQLKFAATDFNLDGQAFPLQLDWQVDLAEPATNSSGQLSGQLQLPQDLALIKISDAQLTSTLKGHGHSSKQQLQLSLDILNAKGDNDQTTQLTGQLKTQPLNLKQLLGSIGQTAPQTADPKALTAISFSSDFSSDLNNLNLNKLLLQLDDTRISGSAKIQQFDSKTALPKVIATLSGGKIDVDGYLPPEASTADKVVAAAKATSKTPSQSPAATANSTSKTSAHAPSRSAPSSEVIIPVADLQPLRLNIGVDFNEMTLKKMRFQQADVKVTANKGLVRLKKLNANFYKGTIKVDGMLDGRKGTQHQAILKSKGTVSNIELAPLLKDLQLDEEYQLAGQLSANFNGRSGGVTEAQLMKLLVGKASVNSPQLTLKPINIEQKYCAVIQASKKEGSQQAWPEQTLINKFNGSASIKNQRLNIPAIDAEVVNLKLGAQGDVNLDSGDFEIIFPLTLTQAWTSEAGCRTKEKFLIGRKLELLRAKGNLADENPTDSIGQNPEGVRDLAEAALKYNLERKLGKKLGLTPAKSNDANGDGKEAEKIDSRDALRGLFDSYINRKLKEQEEKNK